MIITVITPSFKQSISLPAACEHLVFDPASTNGSRQIAASQIGITLIAEPDDGQADAVGKGFQRPTSDVLRGPNSDDVYASDEVFEFVLNQCACAGECDLSIGDPDAHAGGGISRPPRSVRCFASSRSRRTHASAGISGSFSPLLNRRATGFSQRKLPGIGWWNSLKTA
jgi:hypothetical protein